MAVRRRRRVPWASLIIAVVLFAVAIGVLFIIPSSPIDRSHVSTDTNPAQVTLPPTAARATPTFTAAPTSSPGVTATTTP